MSHAGTPGRRRAVGRGAVVVLLLAVWLAVGAVGGPRFGTLSQVQENDASAFLPETAESTEVSARAAAFTDDSVLPFFVLAERDGGLDPDDLPALTTAAEALPDDALAGGGVVGDFLPDDVPVVPVPSEDGDAVLMVVGVDADVRDAALDDGEAALDAVAAALRESFSVDAPEGLTVLVGGPGGYAADLGTAFAGIDGRLLQVTLGVVFVILLLVYRSPVLPFAALLSAGVALAAAGLVVRPLVESGVVELNGQSQGILSILVVGAATDYALLLIARYREELHHHARPWDAMRVAWRATVEPVLASGATVALGLLCLLLSDLGSTRGLGPVGAIGIVAAVLSALTALPVLLLAGRWLFWPRLPRYSAQHSTAADVTRPLPEGLWGRLAALVGRRDRVVWVLTALVLAGLAAAAPSFDARGTAQADLFRDEVESVTAAGVLADHFPGGSGSPTDVLVPEADADAALEVVAATDGVQSVAAVTDGPPSGAPAAQADPLVVDGEVLLEAVLAPAADTPEAEDVVQRLREDLDAVGTEVVVGGPTAQALDTRLASDRDLRVIIPVVLAVVLVVLVLLLRSLLAPLLLVLANVLSFGAAIGVAALVFDHVLDLPGADPAIPLYGFVFLIALGVDYSIFLMTRVREESQRHGTRTGVLRGLAVTGGVITSAGVVLASTFGALASVPLLFLLQVAFIVAFGVLLDTLVVRSLLVPALVHDVGDRVWWPSALARRGAADPAPEPARDPGA